MCAWGITENGSRELVSVRLGMRESKEDRLELGRDLISRGLAAPRLVVADGAPGLISAVEEIWPRADRQHCAVHRLRNLLAKLPKTEQDRIRFNYWSALTDATWVKDRKLRLKVLISELQHAGYESAARRLADDLDALLVHLRYPLRHRERWRSTNLLEGSPSVVRGAGVKQAAAVVVREARHTKELVRERTSQGSRPHEQWDLPRRWLPARRDKAGAGCCSEVRSRCGPR